MAGKTLRAEDVWPLVRKLPKAERLKLADRLSAAEDDWQEKELGDLSDWMRLASPDDKKLLDPKSGKPFSWKLAR